VRNRDVGNCHLLRPLASVPPAQTPRAGRIGVPTGGGQAEGRPAAPAEAIIRLRRRTAAGAGPRRDGTHLSLIITVLAALSASVWFFASHSGHRSLRTPGRKKK